MLGRLLLAAIAVVAATPCVAGLVTVVADLAERDVRSELLYAGSRGPVPTVVRHAPTAGVPAAVLESISRWSYGGNVSYVLSDGGQRPDGYYVVFVFNPPQRIQGADLCAGNNPQESVPAGPVLRVSAAFCLRDAVMTSAAGQIGVQGSQTAAAARLVGAVADVLFPSGMFQNDGPEDGS